MAPLMRNNAEDFYNIGRDKVTGRMCDTNVRNFRPRYTFGTRKV